MPGLARHIAHALAAFLVSAAVVALALVFLLPAPPTRTGNFSSFGPLMVLTLLGPILFVWAWGPAPLGITGLLAAVAIPLASIATLFLGFVRMKPCGCDRVTLETTAADRSSWCWTTQVTTR